MVVVVVVVVGMRLLMMVMMMMVVVMVLHVVLMTLLPAPLLLVPLGVAVGELGMGCPAPGRLLPDPPRGGHSGYSSEAWRQSWIGLRWIHGSVLCTSAIVPMLIPARSVPRLDARKSAYTATLRGLIRGLCYRGKILSVDRTLALTPPRAVSMFRCADSTYALT